jgi:EIN3-binding F-box protein
VAKAFTKFVNLHTFHLHLASNGKMSDGFFNLFIKNVLNLQTLSLTHCKDMTDASLFAMALKCPHLTDLSLIHCGNGFTREGIAALLKANRLFSFRMHTNSHVDKKDILLSISTHCKDLLNLDLLLNPRDLNSVTINKIAEGCTNLRSLTIRHYSIATKLGSTQGGFPHLTCLDMSGTDFASVPSIKHMVAACSQLTSLNLSRCNDVDDKAICSLVMNELIKLQSLNVSYCSRLSDHALVFLGVNCAALTELNLRYCSLITHSGIQALCTPLAGTLKSIDVRNCYAISEDEMWQCEEEGLEIKF